VKSGKGNHCEESGNSDERGQLGGGEPIVKRDTSVRRRDHSEEESFGRRGDHCEVSEPL
jgi:hypothetical protein